MKLLRSIIGLLLMLFCTLISGQKLTDRYEIIPFSESASGAQSVIRYVLEDPEGYIWIATQDGLYRYDGFAFTALPPPGDAQGQHGLHVRKMHIKNDYLYAATSRGLQLVHLPTLITKMISLGEESEGRTVLDVQESAQGDLWIATGTSLHQLTYPDTITQTVLLPDSLRTTARTFSNMARLTLLENNKMWIELDPNNRRDLTLSYDLTTGQFEPLQVAGANTRDFILQLNTNNIFYLSLPEAPEMGTINPQDGGKSPIQLPDGFLRDNPVVRARVFDQETVLLNLRGKKWLFDFRTQSLIDPDWPIFLRDPLKDTDLIYDLYRTRGGITLGYCQQGLIRFIDEHKIFQPYLNLNQILDTRGNPLSSIWTNDTLLWATHYGDGGALMTTTGELLHHVHLGERQPFTMANYWWNIRQVSRDTFWVGTSGGLFWYIPSSQTQGRIQRPGLPEGLLTKGILTQFVDSHGEMWMGIGSGNGAIRWSPDRKTYKYYPVRSDALPFRYPKVLVEDSRADIWMGCQTGGGLVRWDRSTDTFEVITAHVDSVFNFDRIDAMAISPDQQRIYFGGGGGGVFEYDLSSKKFRHWAKLQGLSNNYIHELEWDRHGNLWIGTFNGLNKLDLTNNQITAFYEIHGLPSNEIGLLQRWTDSTMVISTSAGTHIFNPDRLVSNPMANPVHVSRLEINGTNYNHLLQAPGNLRLRYDQNNLSFEISQVNLLDGALNEFSYRLLGLHADWRPLNVANRLSLPGISPGRYQLQFRVCNNNQCQTTRLIGLQILPPFWRSAWFYLLLAVLFGLLVLGYSHIRIRNLRRRQQLRNQISADLHDDIGSSLSSIRFMTEMLGEDPANGGKRGQQLANIKEEIGQISQNLEEIIWYIKPTSDTLEEIHLKLRRFATELLEAKGVELFWQQTDDFHRSKLGSQQKRDYFLTFKEILNNIAKHSRATRVKVNIHSEKNDLVLQVQDDGVGFDPDQEYATNGMHTMKSRTQRLRGQLEISSSQDQGTKVILRFPWR